MSCRHLMTFLSKAQAREASRRWPVTGAWWKCPQCNFWVAGDFEDAPPNAYPDDHGIFKNPNKKSNQ